MQKPQIANRKAERGSMDNAIKGYNTNYSFRGNVDGNYEEFVSDREYWETVGYSSYPVSDRENGNEDVSITDKAD